MTLTEDIGAETDGPESPSASLRVALLEDDDTDAYLFERLLTRSWLAGVDIVRFMTVTDLEEVASTMSPDIVFADLSVADAVGIDTVSRVVSAVEPAPVVILTGSVDPMMPEKSLRVGAKDYLPKSNVDPGTLARTVRYALARAGADHALRQANVELERLNEELDQFAGIVAHDLRAPVRTARMFAGRLVATVTEGGDPSCMADMLNNSLDRMEAMIAGVLALSTVRDGLLECVPVDIPDLIESIRMELAADLEQTGAVITGPAQGVVYAEPTLLREVVRNLLENAMKYRDPDRPALVEVDVQRSAEDGVDRITISDNGPGVEAEYRERMFQPFERLGPKSDGGGGLGLGLAVCDRIMRRHKGRIWADQRPGSPGLRVVLELPSGR